MQTISSYYFNADDRPIHSVTHYTQDGKKPICGKVIPNWHAIEGGGAVSCKRCQKIKWGKKLLD